MNACPEEGKIFEFLSGELTADEAEEVKKHLPSCSKCTLLSRDWQAFQSLIHREDESDFSERFVSQVMERIAPTVQQPRWQYFGSLWAEWRAQAGALAFAALLLVLQMQINVGLSTDTSMTSKLSTDSSDCQLLDSGDCSLDEFIGNNLEVL